jgi:uncharacterized protein (TIGR02594 family)
MDIPPNYAWLAKEPGPNMLKAALALYGTTEVVGERDSPIIMGWAKECGLSAAYSADSVPWCGLFMAVCAQRAGWDVPAKPLWALNWSKFGTDSGQPELGDVLAFVRPGGGHVALYVGEDSNHYHVLGGNQSDRVSIMRIEKLRLYAARRPVWKTAEPLNRRVVRLQPVGAISRDEA